jgi:hypothetical protein
MDEDDMTEHEWAAKHAASKCIAGLQLYFFLEDNKDSPISALETCINFVQLW